MLQTILQLEIPQTWIVSDEMVSTSVTHGISLHSILSDGFFYYRLCYDTDHCITFSQAKNPLLTGEDEQMAFKIIEVNNHTEFINLELKSAFDCNTKLQLF